MTTHKKNRLTGVLQTAAFFWAYFMFASVGVLVSAACAIPAIMFRGERAHAFGQKLIHALFSFFVRYLRVFGLLNLDAEGLTGLGRTGGMIVVANHPCLLDAVLLVSQLPRAVCLMKGSLARNIVLSGTARLAGYIHNKTNLGLVRKCEERLNEGANLLVFPEGTRTVDGKLMPFKMGFALAAIATHSPVQTVIITADSNFLGKGWPFFKQPAFPLRYRLRPGRRFEPRPGEDAKQFGGAVENYFRECLTPAAGNNLPVPERK